MPSTQHIAASPVMSGSRQCTGSRVYVHHSPWYGPSPLQRLSVAMVSRQIMLVLFGGNRNSGVFRWFRSNSEFLSYDQMEVPVKKFLRKKQESQGIRRNPGRNEKQSPRNGHSWNRKMQPSLRPSPPLLEWWYGVVTLWLPAMVDGWRLLNTFYRYEVNLVWVWRG